MVDSPEADFTTERDPWQQPHTREYLATLAPGVIAHIERVLGPTPSAFEVFCAVQKAALTEQ